MRNRPRTRLATAVLTAVSGLVAAGPLYANASRFRVTAVRAAAAGPHVSIGASTNR